LTLFVMASFLFAVIDRQRDATGTHRLAAFSRPWLLAAGLAAGAAIASKWVGLGALAGVAILSLDWQSLGRVSKGFYLKGKGALTREWAAIVLALVVAPSLIYIFSYAPTNNGSVLALPWSRGSWTRNLAREQMEMVNFHLYSSDIYYVGRTNPYVSPAWSWPLVKRPELYYFHEGSGDEHGRIFGMGSPLVWWTS